MTSDTDPTQSGDFYPCTWDDVRTEQIRRFAALTPDQKLKWLEEMLELFPQILEASRKKAIERGNSLR